MAIPGVNNSSQVSDNSNGNPPVTQFSLESGSSNNQGEDTPSDFLSTQNGSHQDQQSNSGNSGTNKSGHETENIIINNI